MAHYGESKDMSHYAKPGMKGRGYKKLRPASKHMKYAKEKKD